MNLTQAIVIAVIVGLLGYDTVAGKLGNPTESQVLRDWASNWTLLPYVAGFLLGHWFGPRQNVSFSAWGYSIPVLGVLLATDILWNIFANGQHPWWRYSLWYALAGIPCGMYIWGQPGSWSPIP